jgi:hypothetical protein
MGFAAQSAIIVGCSEVCMTEAQKKIEAWMRASRASWFG